MKNPKFPSGKLYCIKEDKNIDLHFSALEKPVSLFWRTLLDYIFNLFLFLCMSHLRKMNHSQCLSILLY